MSQQIPYDEMRRLCGLPDVRSYVARRELARMGEQIGEAIQRVANVWTEALEVLAPQLKSIADAPKLKQSPPMWANDPAHTRRTAFGPTKRVK